VRRSANRLRNCAMRMAAIAATSLLWAVSVAAEESAQDTSTIKLSVRTIQASGPSEQHSSDETQGARDRQIHVDGALNDLQPKLAHLPFSHFHLLSRKEETITLRKKNSLQLPNGQSLVFRPIYADTRKVGIWLNWRDKDGSEILNTRLHFDSQDSVLTGTDCAQNEGLILAINAVAVSAPVTP
jgi:hypothetical protein